MARRYKVGGAAEVGVGSGEESSLGLGQRISPGLKEKLGLTYRAHCPTPDGKHLEDGD